MSAGNTQHNLLRAYEMNEKTVAAAVTLRVGRDEDYFQIDNPVAVASASDYDITVPNGIQANQEIFFFCTARTSSYTATVKDAGGNSLGTLTTAGTWLIIRWTDTTSGWKAIASG